MPKKVVVLSLMALAAGCGEYNFTSIPTCDKNQVLTADGKTLKCVDAPTGSTQPPASTDMAMTVQPMPDMATMSLFVPTCAAGKCLTGDNANMLQCVDVSMTNQTLAQALIDITTLKQEVSALQQTVNNLGGGGGGGGTGLYVGNSMTATVGRINSANHVGLVAAADLCGAEVKAGSHMCTVGELYMSEVTGVLKSGTAVPKAWVYAPSWQYPSVGGHTPQALLGGLGDNCGAYTYPTNDRGWTGVAFEWNALMNAYPNDSLIKVVADYALIWHGGSEAACNAKLPIACCK